MQHRQFPAEWEAQDAVLLAWPHRDSDWADILTEAENTFCEIIRHILPRQQVLLTTPDRKRTAQVLAAADIELQRVRLYQLPSDDTWARDFGPLTVFVDNQPLLLDFTFNGWGNKFPASADNQLTTALHRQGAFGNTPVETLDWVLEGGSIESDGEGTLLTTSRCLLEPNRNPTFSRDQLSTMLCQQFGATQVLWLENGELIGDDTDGHIDTLARFAPGRTILYQGCDDPADAHFNPLAAMRDELAGFRSSSGHAYQLVALPLPRPCYAENGYRLPAGYANFLVINGAVLVPTYDDPADTLALEIISKAYPVRETIGIDCRALIRQHGSLHCVTMQIPKGVL